SPGEPSACGQLLHREIGESATGAQLIPGDSDCQHVKNSALSGNSVNANKDSRWPTQPMAARFYWIGPPAIGEADWRDRQGQALPDTERRLFVFPWSSHGGF